ncbi:uncharacterized protein LOC131254174 [Magnolia sinica]|uniref:uncharacterized protein LOC131254174 n=1 Tax=Magnolia sinica TaxID=86752 RepID=UPI00265AEF14|nr:uncharacterized protein LOC131254174 [Magnolia sinica]
MHGFAGERVISEGVISLPVTVGEGQHQATLMVDFLVVNVSSVHKVILSRPSLNAMKDSSVEDLEKVPLDEEDPSKTIWLRTSLSSEQRSEMLTFLRRHKDIFAWSHGDMPGISPDVMVHRLNVDLDHKPVKQKRRLFDAKRYEAIVDEVSILHDAGFIEEVHYPDWITNVVFVKKANKK